MSTYNSTLLRPSRADIRIYRPSSHLSDELNFALEKKGWDNVMDRVQDQHAFSQRPGGGAYWTAAPGFLEMVAIE